MVRITCVFKLRGSRWRTSVLLSLFLITCIACEVKASTVHITAKEDGERQQENKETAKVEGPARTGDLNKEDALNTGENGSFVITPVKETQAEDAANDMADSGTKKVVNSQEGDDNNSSDEDDIRDGLDDGVFDPLSPDPSCDEDASDCWNPPESTIETETQLLKDVTCSYGGDDPSEQEQCIETETETIVDKHWGSDKNVLRMRDKLRDVEKSSHEDRRPPVFLMPGLASTRLVSWKFKSCFHPLLSDVKVQDYVWLNINMLVQMGTIGPDCWKDCLTLGVNQTDYVCKLRPDEGLDAISSLAPGSLGSKMLVGGTNTVYAWLIQWLADNLGYDVGSIVGLPYDWRLSPNVMENRDGFLTLTKLRIEAAVKSNGQPGIMVAHSMGNLVFRYFLEWLRQGMREEAYERLVKKAERRAKAQQRMQTAPPPPPSSSTSQEPSSMLPGWMGGVVSGLDDWLGNYFDKGEEGENHHDSQLRELAQIEGDNNYIEWLEKHIWSYVGLSAPLLGAVNPLRAVISGENMGLPITDEVARVMEVTFGSTHTCNPISSKMGFCDQWDLGDWSQDEILQLLENRARLACLDDIVNDIERDFDGDPWKNFPQLQALLKDRIDWDSEFPLFTIKKEKCDKNEKKNPCSPKSNVTIGPRGAQSGEIFNHFATTWKEKADPLIIKREQLEEAFWNTGVPNTLNTTWDRPHIKHVIMAYGVDVPTEVGYVYNKKEDIQTGSEDREASENERDDGIPTVEKVIWEEAGGKHTEELLHSARGNSLADSLIRKKARKQPLNGEDSNGSLLHSGDGTIPYLSLSWAHTWLLHAARATMFSQGSRGNKNPLDAIKVTHRPNGGMDWKKGVPNVTDEEMEGKSDGDTDTGTSHPHGTKYKPTMVRYHSVGKSRKTGMEYTTTVLEAIGVEHKETTRNYDILAAVFTDVLKEMDKDFNLV